MSEQGGVSYALSNSNISNINSLDGIEEVEIEGETIKSRKEILTFGIVPTTTQPDEVGYLSKFKKDLV